MTTAYDFVARVIWRNAQDPRKDRTVKSQRQKNIRWNQNNRGKPDNQTTGTSLPQSLL